MSGRYAMLTFMDADVDDGYQVRLSMTMAELVTLREAISHADFLGDLPSRSEGEIRVLSDFLRTADSLIPELGTDRYDETVNAAWEAVAHG
jgi:hypothetical protein